MKKVTSFIVALMAAIGAFAQPAAGTFSITPKIGVNVATITNDAYQRTYQFDRNYETTMNGMSTIGFTGGVEAGYQVSKAFAITAGVLYSQQGRERDGSITASDLTLKDKSKFKLDYLNVPILANVYLFKGFAVKAGIQPGFLLSAKSKYNVTATGLAAAFDKHNEVDAKDHCNTFDFAVPVGISYEFYNIVVDARYNIGTTKINNDKEKTDESYHNGVFQLTVGYKINL